VSLMPGTDAITEQALAAASREKNAASLSGAAAWIEPLDYNCIGPRVILRQLRFLKDLGPVQFSSQASLLATG
jgi:hypothetical protein